MDQNPEPNKKNHNPNWAKDLLSELEESMDSVGNSFEKAWKEGKNDPKIKKFGEDMKSTFQKVAKDIDDLFNKKSEE